MRTIWIALAACGCVVGCSSPKRPTPATVNVVTSPRELFDSMNGVGKTKPEMTVDVEADGTLTFGDDIALPPGDMPLFAREFAKGKRVVVRPVQHNIPLSTLVQVRDRLKSAGVEDVIVTGQSAD